MAVEDVGSSQGESVTQVAGAGEREFSTKTRDVPHEKLERSEGKSRLEILESVPIEKACVAGCCRFGCTVVCHLQRLYQGWVNVPCLENVPLSLLMRWDEYMDVDGSSTPVHSDMESEGFTFRESVSYVFLKNLGGVLDTSGLRLF